MRQLVVVQVVHGLCVVHLVVNVVQVVVHGCAGVHLVVDFGAG